MQLYLSILFLYLVIHKVTATSPSTSERDQHIKTIFAIDMNRRIDGFKTSTIEERMKEMERIEQELSEQLDRAIHLTKILMKLDETEKQISDKFYEKVSISSLSSTNVAMPNRNANINPFRIPNRQPTTTTLSSDQENKREGKSRANTAHESGANHQGQDWTILKVPKQRPNRIDRSTEKAEALSEWKLLMESIVLNLGRLPKYANWTRELVRNEFNMLAEWYQQTMIMNNKMKLMMDQQQSTMIVNHQRIRVIMNQKMLKLVMNRASIRVKMNQKKLNPSIRVTLIQKKLNPSIRVSMNQKKLNPSIRVPMNQKKLNPSIRVTLIQKKLNPSIRVPMNQKKLNPSIRVTLNQKKPNPSIRVSINQKKLNPSIRVSMNPSIRVTMNQKKLNPLIKVTMNQKKLNPSIRVPMNQLQQLIRKKMLQLKMVQRRLPLLANLKRLTVTVN
uniref:Uncharacterized protein n=1 Tax=Globodera rostochiensis TaxID=31243 RepID=A0A914IFD2_GLORO